MRLFLVFSLLSFPLKASITWYGYCIVELDRQQVCSGIEINSGNFAGYCDSFAYEQGANSWTARFSTNRRKLRNSTSEFCDRVIENEYEEDDEFFGR